MLREQRGQWHPRRQSQFLRWLHRLDLHLQQLAGLMVYCSSQCPARLLLFQSESRLSMSHWTMLLWSRCTSRKPRILHTAELYFRCMQSCKWYCRCSSMHVWLLIRTNTHSRSRSRKACWLDCSPSTMSNTKLEKSRCQHYSLQKKPGLVKRSLHSTRCASSQTALQWSNHGAVRLENEGAW